MTTSSRHSRIEELFLAASELDIAAREPFLTHQCQGDAGLRKEVESLLSNAVQDGFLDSKDSPGKQLLTRIGVDMAAVDEPVLPAGTRVNSYTVRAVIGSGGMGVVYVAEQEMPRRTVALKLVRGGARSERILRRFEYEAEVLGRLAHPGIAQIYEAGRWQSEQGSRPFIAMEFVRGLMLNQHSDRQRLSPRDRLELIAKVCDAMQHAHRCGVIHRDLKPANILVAEDGQPKILDFGVARALDSDQQFTTMHSGVGQIVGTLPYMSPEQVVGDPAGIDTRTDVYAVGVVMYELLTGRLPYDLKSRPLPEAARIIRDEPPARLSTLDRTLRGDVETIVAKALEKDRTRRYQSAAELAEEIRRFLRGEPILAKQDSAFYVLRRHLKRYRHAAGVGIAFILALIVFSTYALIQRQKALNALALEEIARKGAVEQTGIAVRERDRADQEAEKLRRNLYVSAIAFAQASYSANDVERMKRLLDTCPPDLRGWEWHYLHRLSDTSAGKGTSRHASYMWVFSADGSRAAAWNDPNVASVFDTSTGEEIFCIEGPGQVGYVNFTPDGSMMVAGRLDPPRLDWYDATGGELLYSIPTAIACWPVAMSADGTRIGCRTVDQGKEVGWAIMDSTTGAILAEAAVRGVYAMSFVPDGSGLVTGHSDGMVRVWDARSGAEVKTWLAHDMAVFAATVTPDGANLVTCSSDKTAKLWDLRSGQAWNTIRAHSNKVWRTALSADGRRIATGGTDMTVQISDAFTGELLRSYAGHESTVISLAFTPDGRVLSGSRDQTFRWWSNEDYQDGVVYKCRGSILAGDVSRDGSTLLLADAGGAVYRWTPATMGVPPTAIMQVHPSHINSVSISPDSTVFATAGEDLTARVVDLSSGRELVRIGDMVNRTCDVAISPDSSLLGIASLDGQVILCGSRDGSGVRRFVPHAGGVTQIAFSPDGRRIATAGWKDWSIRIWNIEDIPHGTHRVEKPDPRIRPLGVYTGAGEYAWTLAFTPDGQSVLSASEDGIVRAWEIAGGGEPRMFVGHKGPVYTANFSPDGTRLLTGGWDNSARLWDYRTGQELLNLRGHIYSMYVALFTPTGSIITGSNDGEVRRWTAFAQAQKPVLYE
ncbi:MAG: protein kinase [Phycisphaerales bacterium]|nr:protein kinase [Phycisphaerales bacterium]